MRRLGRSKCRGSSSWVAGVSVARLWPRNKTSWVEWNILFEAATTTHQATPLTTPWMLRETTPSLIRMMYLANLFWLESVSRLWTTTRQQPAFDWKQGAQTVPSICSASNPRTSKRTLGGRDWEENQELGGLNLESTATFRSLLKPPDQSAKSPPLPIAFVFSVWHGGWPVAKA